MRVLSNESSNYETLLGYEEILQPRSQQLELEQLFVEILLQYVKKLVYRNSFLQ